MQLTKIIKSKSYAGPIYLLVKSSTSLQRKIRSPLNSCSSYFSQMKKKKNTAQITQENGFNFKERIFMQTFEGRCGHTVRQLQHVQSHPLPRHQSNSSSQALPGTQARACFPPLWTTIIPEWKAVHSFSKWPTSRPKSNKKLVARRLVVTTTQVLGSQVAVLIHKL